MPFQIEQAIPGLGGLTASASNIIRSALSGVPNPSEARLANAYFGAGSGVDPTSEFLQRRGFDLYGRMANQRQQQGIQDLLGLVSTYSGAVAPTPGQEMADRQQAAQLQQQGSQFNRNFGFEQEQWKKSLSLLDQYLTPQAGGYGTGNVGGQNAMDFSQYSQTYVPYGSPQPFSQAPTIQNPMGGRRSYNVI